MEALDKNGKELKVGDMVTVRFRPRGYAPPIIILTVPILEIFYYSGMYRVKLPGGKTKTGRNRYLRFMSIQVEKED